MSDTPKIVTGALSDFPVHLDQLGARRVLLLTGPSRRGVEQAERSLAGFEVTVFAEARRHVPQATVDAAAAVLIASRAEAVVSLGGGSTTGLGKALRLEHAVAFIAVPSTYAGSEFTNLYGITSEAGKKTGRDDRVRPDVVLLDVALSADMPKPLTLTSLMNALAHPLSVLSVGTADPQLTEVALSAARDVVECIETLLQWPTNRRARERALRAAGAAANVLQQGQLGLHHRLAHLLGGRFDLDHSMLHAVLLPHSVRQLRTEHPAVYALVKDRVGVDDLESFLFDALARAEAPQSLRAMGLDITALEALLAEYDSLPADVLYAGYQGRRPSRVSRREDWGLRQSVELWGPTLPAADRVIVALHGRGSNAGSMTQRVLEMTGNDPRIAIVAPQAPTCSWYENRHTETRETLGVQLTNALDECRVVFERVRQTAPGTPIVLLGFSQGACLALEAFADYGTRYKESVAALVALSGSGIGGDIQPPAFSEVLAGSAVLIGSSEDDPWLTRALTEQTAAQLSSVGCEVNLVFVPGDVHTFHDRHRWLARSLLRGQPRLPTLGGFRGAHESESLPGALPRMQNSPRQPAYGLFAEQVNASGFVAPREQNLRAWLYRIRPSAQQSRFEPFEHPTFDTSFAGKAPAINLEGFAPAPIPEHPTDFLDGLATLGGAGGASLRRGYAVHLYAANRSMHERCFCNADGDLLIIPEQGELTLFSEFGVLEVTPGSIALVPRGVRFSVALNGPAARGTVAEVYGRPFELPDRGPVGANGLVDARHFRAPNAWHEDRLVPGYRVVHKLGGSLFEARQDHSPFDVVAWHGNIAPVTYDLAAFSPVGNVRFDHGDPSLHTVLSAPMDERGCHSLDFVVFAPRWDATEGTFRPPFFHRNVTTELNGIIRQDGARESDAMFTPGSLFLTPSLTPHGALARVVDEVASRSDESADRPKRSSGGSLWFQFECALPFSFAPRALAAPQRIRDWAERWGIHRARFGV
jgi:homogentisate 1,2-dioxygenase